MSLWRLAGDVVGAVCFPYDMDALLAFQPGVQSSAPEGVVTDYQDPSFRREAG